MVELKVEQLIKLIYDVAAEGGGALTVLKEYYENAILDSNPNNKHYFVVSKVDLKERSNVKIIKYPWIKKSWIHRIYFDYFIAPKLVRRFHVDEILSLQNLTLPFVETKQILYVHNAIPFSDFKFSILKNPILWIYQNIIGRLIKKSIVKANSIIVQTEWMKEKILSQTGIENNKIKVELPKVNIPVISTSKKSSKKRLFFYPANSSSFKNHKIIIKALKYLKFDELKKCQIIFTLDKNLPKHFNEINDIIEKYSLPVEFVGNLSIEKMCEYYSKSILIYPSYIESLGLPLLEAMKYKCQIISVSCNYAKEVLRNYEYVDYFDYNDEKHLTNILRKYINND